MGKLGLTVDVADNGKIAIATLSKENFDLVFMDMQMPEMDGIEATKTIRDPNSSVLNHQIPIIAMTANAMKGDREACLNAGMNDYVPKPINRKELIEALERVEHGYMTMAKGSKKKKDLLTDENFFDENALLDRLSGDRQLMKTILTAFIQDVKSQIDRLEKLIEDKDIDGARRQAHSIKGASGNAGAKAMQNLAVMVENSLKDSDSVSASKMISELRRSFEDLHNFLISKEKVDG